MLVTAFKRNKIYRTVLSTAANHIHIYDSKILKATSRTRKYKRTYVFSQACNFELFLLRLSQLKSPIHLIRRETHLQSG